MKNAIQDRFQKRHVVLPVVPIIHYGQALRNATLAFDSGCDGVFLKNDCMDDITMQRISQLVRTALPGKWIGVKYLIWGPKNVFSELSKKDVDGVWSHCTGIDESEYDQSYATDARTLQQHKCPNTLYFGEMTFKDTRSVADLENAARIASSHMDVVTISGLGTRIPKSIDKIRRMKLALDGGALAMATSSITPENVVEYMPFTDAFLVEKGISTSCYELDPKKTRELVQRVQGGV